MKKTMRLHNARKFFKIIISFLFLFVSSLQMYIILMVDLICFCTLSLKVSQFLKTQVVLDPQGVCVAVAALMLYFLMAAFCWTLIEGIFLYFFVVKVYNIDGRTVIYHFFSWSEFFDVPFHYQTLYGAIKSLSRLHSTMYIFSFKV